MAAKVVLLKYVQNLNMHKLLATFFLFQLEPSEKHEMQLFLAHIFLLPEI